MKKAYALAKTVHHSIKRPFKKFTNDVVEIWIQEGLLRWERRRIPCEVDESILDKRTLETRDEKGRLSKYAEEMIRAGEDENGEGGDDDSPSSFSSSLASSSPSQRSLGRSTRESHRRLSRARTTHHPPSSTDSWAQKYSPKPPKRFSISVSLSANSSSNPRPKSSSHSRSHPRSRAPPSPHHGQSSDYDSGIGMSEDDFNPHDDDDAQSNISKSSINPGSSISHSDRAYSSSHSSHRAHPKKDVSPPISVVEDQLEREEAIRRRIFANKKAEYMNSSSSSSSSSHHPPPSSSSGSGSQSRSRAQSRRSQTPTQASHIPRSNNPFRLSVAGEAKPDPWVGR
ncbi:uncharacterized protein Bfra_000522 [Botrytis fragariae]|uniref:Uncharacterized protein n=1 Tax=Botrytis fragariae TaxID=1964551 RepID=A0A8H6EN25_9HELO|nr:uncharacterized protein Bfra_000522 [Botrytis fragariae]KAF5878356.1 hypothetical protein Bfra_000522 [Botrytis fragariae]